MTADVDVTVIVDGIDVQPMLDGLAREQILPRWTLDDAFVRQSRVLPLIYDNQMPIDVVLGSPGLDEYFLDRSERIDVGGTTIRVARREDLVCMKLLAGRPHDLQDAAAMVRAGACDLDEVRAFVEGMAEALGDAELPERLTSLLVGLERER